MKANAQLSHVRADAEVFAEITRRRAAAAIIEPAIVAEPTRPRRSRKPRRPSPGESEAIILREGRPTLLVRGGSFEVPRLQEWQSRLLPTKARIESAIRSVGRVELAFGGAPFIGTGWMVAPNILVTNRHVAGEFSVKQGQEFAIRTDPIGQSLAPRIDFNEEYSAVEPPFEVAIDDVLYVAPDDDSSPDLALLRISAVGGRRLPPPISLLVKKPKKGQIVAAIGYPAEDYRNDAADQARLFGGIFNVKRVAPGLIVDASDPTYFTHDCTTLGGSSGSAIVDVGTGSAVGLHFAGEYLDANYAVPAAVVAKYLKRVSGKDGARPTTVTKARRPALPKERVVAKSDLVGRDGYRSVFIGSGDLLVPVPKLSAGLIKLAYRLRGARSPKQFDYVHYSLVMHRERRMAIFTAVNIDGARLVPKKRAGNEPWALDPRLPADVQIDNEAYEDNDLDRGHLVRRADPVWGEPDEASLAEQDTFFFTNCTPQQKTFNEHLWLGLESYLLGHAKTDGFKACVFTGPVFRTEDLHYRGIQVPGAFWKVAVMKKARSPSLVATGYVVSQRDLLSDLEFVFGQFKTYQVPLAEIERQTGLRFDRRLREADPLRRIEANAVRQLDDLSDVTV